MRIAAGSPGGLLEAFKPGTAPPDSYSVIGYEGSDPRMPMGVTPEADRAGMRPSGLYQRATCSAPRAGIAAVPPFFFGAARYILVSAVLLFVVRDLRAVFAGRALRIVITGTLVVAATYAFIYWGMQYVASGVSGVVNMSMNPVCLFGLAILLGQERPSWRHALALVLGIAGLLLLFSGKAEMSGSGM